MPITSTLEMSPERNVANYDAKVGKIKLMRRKELWDLARGLNISFPDKATKDEMLEIFQGHRHAVKAFEQAVAAAESQLDDKSQAIDAAMKAWRTENREKIVPKPEEPKSEVAGNNDAELIKNLGWIDLKKKAKELGISCVPGMKKPEILQAVLDHIGAE